MYRKPRGEGIHSLSSMVRRLQSDRDGLRDLGIGNLPGHVRVVDLGPHSLEVINEDECASLLGTLTLCILGRRLVSELWHTHGLPGLFPKLLDDTAAPPLLIWLQRTYNGWLDVQKTF